MRLRRGWGVDKWVEIDDMRFVKVFSSRSGYREIEVGYVLGK